MGHLIRGLYDAAEGRPKQWHFLDDLYVPQSAEAVALCYNSRMDTARERERRPPYRCRAGV